VGDIGGVKNMEEWESLISYLYYKNICDFIIEKRTAVVWISG
jgi:hypothetical protein